MRGATSPSLVLAVALVACGGAAASSAPSNTGAPAPAAAQGSAVPDAAKAVEGARPDLRKCYADARVKDPTLEGSVVVLARVDAKGAVTSATPDGTPSLPADVVACITARVAQLQFTAPGGSGSTLKIPLRFKPNP